MRKLLIASAVLGAVLVVAVQAAPAAAAPGVKAPAVQAGGQVQSVQYYEPGWREREAWRLRREDEWRRREAWRRQNERREYYGYGYAPRPVPYYGPRY